MENVYATKPWLKFYDKEVPPTLTYPSMTYAAFIRLSFDYVPDGVGLYYMDNSMTYRQLDQLSNQFANFLISRGCRSGDTVGVHLLNTHATYIASIGI